MQVLALIVVVVPYALPIRPKYTISGVHLCYVIALAVSAVYVLTTPPSPIGHPGYFTHKQELGLLAAIGIILSSYELLQRGWRRLVALVAIALAFWLVFESQSKSALAFALVAIAVFGVDIAALQEDTTDASVYRRRCRGRVHVRVQPD